MFSNRSTIIDMLLLVGMLRFCLLIDNVRCQPEEIPQIDLKPLNLLYDTLHQKAQSAYQYLNFASRQSYVLPSEVTERLTSVFRQIVELDIGQKFSTDTLIIEKGSLDAFGKKVTELMIKSYQIRKNLQPIVVWCGLVDNQNLHGNFVANILEIDQLLEQLKRLSEDLKSLIQKRHKQAGDSLFKEFLQKHREHFDRIRSTASQSYQRLVKLNGMFNEVANSNIGDSEVFDAGTRLANFVKDYAQQSLLDSAIFSGNDQKEIQKNFIEEINELSYQVKEFLPNFEDTFKKINSKSSSYDEFSKQAKLAYDGCAELHELLKNLHNKMFDVIYTFESLKANISSNYLNGSTSKWLRFFRKALLNKWSLFIGYNLMLFGVKRMFIKPKPKPTAGFWDWYWRFVNGTETTGTTTATVPKSNGQAADIQSLNDDLIQRFLQQIEHPQILILFGVLLLIPILISFGFLVRHLRVRWGQSVVVGGGGGPVKKSAIKSKKNSNKKQIVAGGGGGSAVSSRKSSKKSSLKSRSSGIIRSKTRTRTRTALQSKTGKKERRKNSNINKSSTTTKQIKQ